MGSFSGFNMPLFYRLGTIKEHLHTRVLAGLFDISHMLHIEIEGNEASDLISRLCPYVARKQLVGRSRYSYMLNDNAGIIDDMIVTRLDLTRYLIISNAGCAEKDISHIENVSGCFDVSINVIERGFLALQGPKAESILKNYFNVTDMVFMSAREFKEGWFIFRTGYTGEDGFEIAMPLRECSGFAKSLLDHVDVEWIGLGARDSLRLESGFPLYGQDLSDDITPHEAGLLWAIPKDLHQSEFIGAFSLKKKILEGRKKMRIGLISDGHLVRGGTKLQLADRMQVGRVTSGGFSPSLGIPIAMGFVDIDAINTNLFANIRGKKIAMKHVSLPFVSHSYKR